MSEEIARREPPRFRVGAALGSTFSVLFRNIVPFGILALIFSAPAQVLPLLFEPADAVPGGGFGLVTGVAIVVHLVFSFLLAATLVYGTVLELRGGHATLTECVARGLGLVLPVAVVGILVSLIIIVGSILLLIPGLIAAVVLWVAVPAAVVERPGIVASLKRSADLTKGSRWPLFGLVVILVVINTVIGGIVGAIVGFTGGFATGEILSPTFIFVINLVVQAFSAALFAVASAVAYHDLRIAKEGVSADEIAKVFD